MNLRRCKGVFIKVQHIKNVYKECMKLPMFLVTKKQPSATLEFIHAHFSEKSSLNKQAIVWRHLLLVFVFLSDLLIIKNMQTVIIFIFKLMLKLRFNRQVLW